jgi:hypothetical protein
LDKVTRNHHYPSIVPAALADVSHLNALATATRTTVLGPLITPLFDPKPASLRKNAIKLCKVRVLICGHRLTVPIFYCLHVFLLSRLITIFTNGVIVWSI